MKILIIGFGSIGKRYHKILLNKKIEIAVHDINLKFNYNKNYKILKNFLDIKNWQPDGIIISNPSFLHIDTLKRYFNISPKSFLIEKPLDTSLKKICKLDKLNSKDKKKIFVVNNIEYFLPIKNLLHYKKKIGKIYFSNITFGHNLNYMRRKNSKNFLVKKESGGIILDCIHELMYAEHLFGKILNVNVEYYKLSNIKSNFSDMARLRLSHKNNIYSFIHLDYFQEVKNRGCEIFGEKGTISWKSFGKKKMNNRFNFIKKIRGKENYKKIYLKIDLENQYKEMIKDWINYIKYGKVNGLKNLEASIKFYLNLKKIF